MIRELVVTTTYTSGAVGYIEAVDESGFANRLGSLLTNETDLWLEFLLILTLGARRAGVKVTHKEITL